MLSNLLHQQEITFPVKWVGDGKHPKSERNTVFLEVVAQTHSVFGGASPPAPPRERKPRVQLLSSWNYQAKKSQCKSYLDQLQGHNPLRQDSEHPRRRVKTVDYKQKSNISTARPFNLRSPTEKTSGIRISSSHDSQLQILGSWCFFHKCIPPLYNLPSSLPITIITI